MLSEALVSLSSVGDTIIIPSDWLENGKGSVSVIVAIPYILVERGKLASVSDDYRRLLSYRKMYQQPTDELCFVDTRFIGLYPEEVNILVESMQVYEHCMDRSSNYINNLRLAILNNDLSAIRNWYEWGKQVFLNK